MDAVTTLGCSDMASKVGESAWGQKARRDSPKCFSLSLCLRVAVNRCTLLNAWWSVRGGGMVEDWVGFCCGYVRVSIDNPRQVWMRPCLAQSSLTGKPLCTWRYSLPRCKRPGHLVLYMLLSLFKIGL